MLITSIRPTFDLDFEYRYLSKLTRNLHILSKLSTILLSLSPPQYRCILYTDGGQYGARAGQAGNTTTGMMGRPVHDPGQATR